MNSPHRPLTEVNFDNIASGQPFPKSIEPFAEQQLITPTNHDPSVAASHRPKKRRYNPQGNEQHLPAGVEPPTLPSIHESRAGRSWELQARKESPWNSYGKVFDLDLDLNGLITVAQRRAPSSGLVAVRTFPLAAAEKALYMHKRAQYNCIVEALEAFTTEESFYIVLKHMPISLEQIVDSVKYPTELQLATILGQILDGLVFLEGQRLEHGSLTCPNILLSTEGDVKIANQQCCDKPRGHREPRDVRALGTITMELMQKYTQGNGAVGVEDLDRWPSDSEAVAFLLETTSAGSARELSKHALLKARGRKADLTGLIFVAEVSARRNYAWRA